MRSDLVTCVNQVIPRLSWFSYGARIGSQEKPKPGPRQRSCPSTPPGGNDEQSGGRQCGNRLQYLFEVLHVIRKIKGARFPDIETELSKMLSTLAASCESVPFQEVMRFCDKCSDAIDSKVRECSTYLYRRTRINRGSGASGCSGLSTGAGLLQS
jgi:hypothetical protein